MKRWHRAIIVIVSILILLFPISKYAMSSDKNDDSSKYRVEHLVTESSKLKLSGEALRELNQDAVLLATVKVSMDGYIPSGVEVRTRISPLIFTANIPHEVLERLEADLNVVSIEPVYKLRSY
jgi:hypothetical protein